MSKHGGHAYPGLDKVYDDMLVHSEPRGAFNGKAGFAYPTGDGSADTLLKARVSSSLSACFATGCAKQGG